MKFLSSGHAKAFGQPQSSNGTGNGAADRATWLSNGSRYVSYTSVTGKFFLACGEPRAPTYLAWSRQKRQRNGNRRDRQQNGTAPDPTHPTHSPAPHGSSFRLCVGFTTLTSPRSIAPARALALVRSGERTRATWGLRG